jgi:hypothetical protein
MSIKSTLLAMALAITLPLAPAFANGPQRGGGGGNVTINNFHGGGGWNGGGWHGGYPNAGWRGGPWLGRNYWGGCGWNCGAWGSWAAAGAALGIVGAAAALMAPPVYVAPQPVYQWTTDLYGRPFLMRVQ